MFSCFDLILTVFCSLPQLWMCALLELLWCPLVRAVGKKRPHFLKHRPSFFCNHLCGLFWFWLISPWFNSVVEFKDEEFVKKAIETMNKHDLSGRPLNIKEVRTALLLKDCSKTELFFVFLSTKITTFLLLLFWASWSKWNGVFSVNLDAPFLREAADFSFVFALLPHCDGPDFE